jgi:hypothetical protein
VVDLERSESAGKAVNMDEHGLDLPDGGDPSSPYSMLSSISQFFFLALGGARRHGRRQGS